MPAGSILVADDDTAIRTVLNQALSRAGYEVRLTGINWFGLETSNHVLHGLWTGRALADFLADFKSKGFNALRIPVSPETISTACRASATTSAMVVSGDRIAAPPDTATVSSASSASPGPHNTTDFRP